MLGFAGTAAEDTMQDATKQLQLSTARRMLMRVPFALTGVLFSLSAWSTLIEHWGTFEPLEGVAFSFWGALSLLSLIGIRFPVRMLPLLLIQFFYKLIWLMAVGYPLLARDALDAGGAELFQANALGVAIDTVAIPWIYVAKTYLIGTRDA